MTKEKPKPLLIRFYKDQMKFIKKEAKRMRVSRAEVVRHYVDGYRLPVSSSEYALK